MPLIPEVEHTRMIRSWQQWRVTLAEAMDQIHDALEAREYLMVGDLMAEITQQQAQMSVTMTNVLIRHGIIQGDASDD